MFIFPSQKISLKAHLYQNWNVTVATRFVRVYLSMSARQKERKDEWCEIGSGADQILRKSLYLLLRRLNAALFTEPPIPINDAQACQGSAATIESANPRESDPRSPLVIHTNPLVRSVIRRRQNSEISIYIIWERERECENIEMIQKEIRQT